MGNGNPSSKNGFEEALTRKYELYGLWYKNFGYM